MTKSNVMTGASQTATVQYTECYLAFLDIMGVKKLVEDSSKAASLVGLVNSLASHETRGVDPWRSMIFKGTDPTTGNIRTWTLQVRPFSDCIVLFVPTETQGLSWLLGKVRYLHDSVISMGYMMRGAVVINGMYWDDSWSEISSPPLGQTASVHCETQDEKKSYITLGPAIVEAYLLESGRAIYPRIIFSDKLVAHIDTSDNISPDHSLDRNADRKKRAFPLTSGDPSTSHLTLRDFVQKDTDGMSFFHVLSEHMDRQGEGRPVIDTTTGAGKRFIAYQYDRISNEEWMQQVRGFLQRKLEEHKGKPLYAKYRWFARYYNGSAAGFSLAQLEVKEDALWVSLKQRVCSLIRTVVGRAPCQS